MQYVDMQFDHEKQLLRIIENEATDEHEIGGVGLQMLVGRASGLREWAQRAAGSSASQLISSIVDNISGRGKTGGVLVGEIDIDNIDNVFRMAFHMGLPCERALPERLARAAVGLIGEQNATPVFQLSAEADIVAWLETRRQVYERLMLAERDFAGKLMILYAIVRAYEGGEISQTDWKLTDQEFTARLLNSSVKDTAETSKRWIAGELWECAPLKWMAGDRPVYSKLRSFSADITRVMECPCFAYGIKDKRHRRLTISFVDRSQREYGMKHKQWLLGVGTSRRKSLSSSEIKSIFKAAESAFNSKVIGAASRNLDHDTQQWLI